MRRRLQGSVNDPIMFFMADSADHITGKTGLAPVVELSKCGGVFAQANGTVEEVGYGWYKLIGNSVDRDTLGTLVIHAEAEGADPFDMDVVIISNDPPSVEDIDTELSDNHGSGAWADPDFEDTVPYSDILVEPDSTPISGALIIACSDSGMTNVVDSDETDADGAFTLNLLPGTYYLRAVKAGYTFPDWSKVIGD